MPLRKARREKAWFASEGGDISSERRADRQLSHASIVAGSGKIPGGAEQVGEGGRVDCYLVPAWEFVNSAFRLFFFLTITYELT
jgi:hypothetical protein